MKILITGKSGYIARSLYRTLKDKHEIDCIGREDFDLANPRDTHKWFVNKYYDVVIHTAIVGGSRLYTDKSDVLITNLSMFFNLYNNQSHFKKLISFGSGAEDFPLGESYYGTSKKIIAQYINTTPDFYNLRIYGGFDEYELNTRFIKSNILRTLDHKSVIIYNDRYMDFIYMTDLISIVEYYLINDQLPKSNDCCYPVKYKLSDIAKLICGSNGCIKMESSILMDDYIGTQTTIPVKYIGLEQGIYNTINALKSL